MQGSAQQFVDEVPTYAIRDGCMYVTTGGWSLVMPLRTFEAGMARAAAVIAKHRLKVAEVVPIKGRRREH